MVGNYFRGANSRRPNDVAIPPAIPNRFVRAVALGALSILCVSSCRTRPRVLTKPAAAVESALRPEAFARTLPKIGKAHLRGTTRFQAGPAAASLEGITTETDIWMDQKGNWRLVEINDRDGGREIVRHDHELAVALRYGKMIRRTAEEPEPTRLLGEGVGGPFAAWDLIRDVTTVDDFGEEVRGGRKVHVYNITKAKRQAEPVSHLDPSDRRAWRKTIVPTAVSGTLVVDAATGAPLVAELHARYGMRRPPAGSKEAGDDVASWATLTGAIDVKTSIEEIGTSPEIAKPDAEDAPQRQRTVPEERALLGGLARTTTRSKGVP